VAHCRITRGSIEEIIDDLNTCLDESYAVPAVLQDLKVKAYELIRKGKRLYLLSQEIPTRNLIYFITHHAPLTTHHSPSAKELV
jgi:hypothetical protein